MPVSSSTISTESLPTTRQTKKTSTRFAGIQPFPKFGHWSDPIRIAYPGTTFRLVNWMAQQRRLSKDYDALWESCVAANPDCFHELQVVNLCKPSWFLPRGETVFQVIKNPTNIPDNPPRGVMLRHFEAMDVFGEQADYFFLRPTFASESMDVFTGDLARAHAEEDKSDIIFMSKLYGPALRQMTNARRLVDHAVDVGAFLAEKGCQAVFEVGRRITNQVERSRIRKQARELSNATHPDRLRAVMLRALELGMFDEAQVFGDALQSWTRDVVSSHVQGLSLGIGAGDTAAQARSESEFVRLARSRGAKMDVTQLRQVYREIQELRTWDPILCFELKNQPGNLWLEAHWFDGQDGRQYVHY